MKSISKIIGIVILLGCKTSGFIYMPSIDQKYSINDCGYHGNSELTYEFFKKDKEFSFIGYYAIDNFGEKSHLKIKECSEYYPNGVLKSRGSYQIGSYTQCCSSGPCDQYYNYKVGEWHYYHPNEQLHVKCEYDTSLLFIKTSCEGGDSLKFNTVKLATAFDENGDAIDASVALLSELTNVASGHYSFKVDETNGKQITLTPTH